MLSKYASEIIKILVHQDDKFITNAQIAKMLNVSERSVSSYVLRRENTGSVILSEH